MKTKVSAATIIHYNGSVLIGHVTGDRHWDLPKGGVDNGETFLDGAIRECQEEFGIDLDPEYMRFVGQLPYNKKKDIAVFLYDMGEEYPTDRMNCCSYVNGDIDHPEIDQYQWVEKSRVLKYFSPVMGKCWEDNDFLSMF